MNTVHLGRSAINQLNHDTMYRYFLEEDSVYRIKNKYLDTTVALSNKSSSNPNGWEQADIRVKGGEEE